MEAADIDNKFKKITEFCNIIKWIYKFQFDDNKLDVHVLNFD